MKLDELNAIVSMEIQDSVSYMGGKLAEQRRQAVQYYMADKLGNEVEGRSQVVSSDVADTVEWILPSLLRIFTTSDDAVRFDPQGPEDEDAASQASDYVNWVFYRQNPGFLILHDWIKDCLIEKNGIVKHYWDATEDVKKEDYTGLTDDDLALILQQEGVEPINHKAYEINGEMVHDLTVQVTTKSGRIRIEVVPPEEFLIARDAKSIQDARFVGHRIKRTKSDLRKMGYDNKAIDQLGSDDNIEWSAERIERYKYDNELIGFNNQKPEKMFWVTECYIDVDWDGDGIAETRKVVRAGNQILSNEEWDGEPPFSSITPILMPHKFFGRSVADLVIPLQEIKTTLVRQALDNIYLANNGRYFVKGDVNLSDLLTTRPGGVVRGGINGEVTALETPSIGQNALDMIEYVDSVREARTGVTKYNQGLDANTLNKTATGINQIMNAAQQRIELIARVIAETGIKNMFKYILKLASQHTDKPQIIRLTNKWVPMDPREWDTEFDVTINVGLGTGNKDQMLQHVQALAQYQAQLVQMGLTNVVQPKNFYNTAKEMTKNSGFKSVDPFFTDPSPDNGDPQQQLAQAQMQIQQDQMQMQQMQQQFQEQMQQAQQQLQDLQSQLQQAKSGADAKMMEIDNKSKVMDFESQSNADIAQQKIQLEREIAQEKLRIEEEKVRGELAIKERLALLQAYSQMTQQDGNNDKTDGEDQDKQDIGPIIEALNGLKEAISKPKMIIEKNGKPVGIQ